MMFEIFDVVVPLPTRFEFVQPGEFEDPYYEVSIWAEEDEEYVCAGLLAFCEKRWSFECYQTDIYALDSWDLREIADKLDSLNKEVGK